VREGLKLIGAITYDHPGDFAETIGLITRGAFKPGQFVTKRFPLDHLVEAFALATTRKEGKIVIEVGIF